MEERGAGVFASYVVAIFMAALMLSVIVPPFQSPDEFEHVRRAYLISKGELLMSAPEGQSSGGRVDTGLLAYQAHFGSLPFQPDVKHSFEQSQAAAQARWQHEREFSPAPGAAYYLPLIYAPQAVGLAVGRWMDMSVDRSYRLARLLTLLAAMALVAVALQMVRAPLLALALLALPMSLFQLTAATIDGLSLSLTLFAAAVFLKLISEPPPPRAWLMPALLLSIFVLVTTRVQLLPMLILPFVLYYYQRVTAQLYGGLALTAASLGWVAFAMSQSVDLRMDIGASTGTIILYYMTSPLALLSIFWDTLSDPEYSYFYLDSFIGILGWLDTPLPDQRYRYLWALLGLMLLASIGRVRWREEWVWRTALVLCAVGSFVLAFIAMLITWTPHPGTAILGVQGRYFAPPAVLLCFALLPTHRSPTSVVGIAGWTLLGALLIYSASSTTTAVLQRYYLDTSSVVAAVE